MINRNEFLLKEVPTFHPASSRYVEWWRQQKKYCIEGKWQSGIWMPSNLYFYSNFGTILLNKTKNSKNKVAARPFLRDLEWEFFYNWAEARGFSGFELDEDTTCHRMAQPKVYDGLPDFEKGLFRMSSPFAFKADGTPKKYEPARTYLRKQHSKDLGRALYENQAQDFMMMGSRGFGKSYSVGVGVVLHEWLFDGMTEYRTDLEELPNVSICVGAGDSKYADGLIDKTQFALANLPGSQEIDGTIYPSPFAKKFTGSWHTGGKDITATYKKKVGGKWVDKGTKSSIKLRSFKDNPLAANGLRCSVMVMEEIGIFDNLIAARNASVECMKNGSNKFGSMMLLGTGGDMDSGTVDAHTMFYDPESFDLLVFDDIWENTGKIAYFVPAYLGLNDYKDDNGITRVAEAKAFLEKEREKLRANKSGASAIDDELQNRPLVPSEAFLTKKGNIFPIDELRNRLITLKQEEVYNFIAKPVTMFLDPKKPRGVDYRLDLEKKLLPLDSFPLTDKQKGNREGAVMIYEFPIEVDGGVPKDMYIIGHDPYKDDSASGDSLGTIYVLKKKKYVQHGYDEIVASYVGRPYEGRAAVNKVLYMLSLFYGEATIYFENMVGNVKEFFEKIRRLDLLARQPQTVLTKKAGYMATKSTVTYGYPMSNRAMKAETVQYIRDWLIEPRGTTAEGKPIRNLDLIPDPGLIQELIAFNYDGNFDRVMGFGGCIIGLEETYNRYKEMQHSREKENSLDFLTNNRRLFRHEITANSDSIV